MSNGGYFESVACVPMPVSCEDSPLQRLPHSRLLTGQEWDSVRNIAGLTARELEVCELLFACKTRVEIADRLGIKPRTVRQHLEKLHAKFNVKNRVGVVLRVIQLRDHAR